MRRIKKPKEIANPVVESGYTVSNVTNTGTIQEGDRIQPLIPQLYP